MGRKTLGLILLTITLCLLVFASLFAVTSTQTSFFAPQPTATPLPTATATPTPIPTPQPVLTVKKPLPQVSADALYLVDQNTGNILIDINGEKPMPMASITKMMTALIAIQTTDLDQLIPVTQRAVDHVQINGSSSAGLVVGDKLPLRAMLYALLLESGGDAAYSIAEALGGTQEKFIERMNLFTYRLRLFQTHYNNPDGLNFVGDDNHYSTAHDVAKLAQYAMRNTTFAKIVQTQTYTVTTELATYTWTNTNKLLGSYQGMQGIKTGHTDAAGYCLVFAATQDGHNLLGVIFNSPSEEQRNKDVVTVLDWGFALPLLPPT